VQYVDVFGSYGRLGFASIALKYFAVAGNAWMGANWPKARAKRMDREETMLPERLRSARDDKRWNVFIYSASAGSKQLPAGSVLYTTT
jgi:hypothetical protein